MVVTLLSGVAYVAISEDTDVPLALSEADMEKLRATGIPNAKCLGNRPACNNTTSNSCQENPYGYTYRKLLESYEKCVTNYTNYVCNQHSAVQEHCEFEVYNDTCTAVTFAGKLTEKDCQTTSN